MKKKFPVHGIVGIASLLISEFFLFEKVDPFYSWFYCLAWWSYILIVDAVIYRLKRNSLIVNRTKEFFLMIPWSIFIWLIFEAANLALKNWYYINLPHSILERWSGYAIAYGTVLPGLFETAELLRCIFKSQSEAPPLAGEQRRQMRGWHSVLILLGILSLVSSLLIPEYCFPLIWAGFIFLLEPFNYRFGGKSLLRDLEEGNPWKLYLLLIAGLICGLLWEFWNFWALSKWVYTVPFFDKLKGFEMPFLGFLGFPPFAVQAYVIYNFISLFRFKRGWEESTYRLNLERKTRPLTSLLVIIMIGSFSVLILRAIDSDTVDSYYTRLEDAYWIDPQYQAELPKIGISTLEDLKSKTKDKKETDELALRLLIPKELLIQWVEQAHLVQLKGLGIENLRLLQRAGINSVPDLAKQDPEKLYEKIERDVPGKSPRRSKIRIWVREARRRVRSSP